MKHLYHGTRYLSQILKDNCIKCAELGDTHVSLTYSKKEAAYWAALDRDDYDGHGWIIVLDRHLLKRDFDLSKFKSGAADRHEREIACFWDIAPLTKYILSIVPVPTNPNTPMEVA